MNLLEGKISISMAPKKTCKSYGIDRKTLVTSKWLISSIEVLDTTEIINKYVYYQIKVTTTDDKSWIIKRRYSNFDTFEQNVKLRDKKKALPLPSNKLPSKNMNSTSFVISPMKEDDIKKRREQLNLYMKDILFIANKTGAGDDITESIRRLRSELNYFLEVKSNISKLLYKHTYII